MPTLSCGVDGGTEIRLFDPQRRPHDWTEVIRPTDCAVFLKHRTCSALLNPDGRLFLNPDEATCLVFPRIDAAQRFCEAKVAALPHVRCEVYDSEGMAQPRLLVVVHPDFQHNQESRSTGR